MKKRNSANWDRPYKVIFSNPDIVKDLIISHYNSDWVADADFSTLEKLPTEYTGDELDETRDDVIWQVNFKNTKLYIVLLIEFQSRSEKYMAARMLSYIGNLYLDLIRTKKVKGNAQLPPVFPVVIYNGKTPWKAVQSFRKLVNCPYSSLEKYIPDAFYEVFDEQAALKSISDPQNLIDLLVKLEFCKNPQEMKSLIAMLCDLAGASAGFDHLLRGFVLLIRRALIRSGKNSVSTQDNNWDEISSPQEVNNMLETTMKNWADNYYSQGVDKGIDKGIEKVALNMLAKGKSYEEIVDATDLTVDQIKALANRNQVCEPAATYKARRKKKKNKIMIPTVIPNCYS